MALVETLLSIVHTTIFISLFLVHFQLSLMFRSTAYCMKIKSSKGKRQVVSQLTITLQPCIVSFPLQVGRTETHTISWPSQTSSSQKGWSSLSIICTNHAPTSHICSHYNNKGGRLRQVTFSVYTYFQVILNHAAACSYVQ